MADTTEINANGSSENNDGKPEKFTSETTTETKGEAKNIVAADAPSKPSDKEGGEVTPKETIGASAKTSAPAISMPASTAAFSAASAASKDAVAPPISLSKASSSAVEAPILTTMQKSIEKPKIPTVAVVSKPPARAPSNSSDGSSHTMAKASISNATVGKFPKAAKATASSKTTPAKSGTTTTPYPRIVSNDSKTKAVTKEAATSSKTTPAKSGTTPKAKGPVVPSSVATSATKAKTPSGLVVPSKVKSSYPTIPKAGKASGNKTTAKITLKNLVNAKGPPKKTLKKNLEAAAGAPKLVMSGTKSLKKGARKKRKNAGPDEPEEKGDPSVLKKVKKIKRKKEKEEEKKPDKSKKPRKQPKKPSTSSTTATINYVDQFLQPTVMSAAQLAVQEQMRKALEEDQYSANGSIVDTDTDDEDSQFMYKGQLIRLDRAHLLQITKKYNWLGEASGNGSLVSTVLPSRGSGASKDSDANDQDDGDEEEGILNADGTTNNSGTSMKKKPSRSKKKGRNQYTNRNSTNNTSGSGTNSSGFRIDGTTVKGYDIGNPKCVNVVEKGMDTERDEGSIFGQTTGSSQFTWVECDKCKKWRRLRGIVDERKLPPKWYCTMNKNDPERARCSAPEEEYEASHTPESAADARTRKHLRVWVRRLQCNEQYESRLPTLTRGKKRSVASSSKEPHEWIRCCNPSCGKWRAILRIMDAKQNVIDRTCNGEWYCVMNTWDEKTASCAAPQENLPAVGCPPWVMQDEN